MAAPVGDRARDMRKTVLALMVSVAPACIARQLPADPGDATVTLAGPWIQGQPGLAYLDWPNKELCDEEDWSCTGGSRLTMTVMSVRCNGCDVWTIPTGRTALNESGLAGSSVDQRSYVPISRPYASVWPRSARTSVLRPGITPSSGSWSRANTWKP